MIKHIATVTGMGIAVAFVAVFFLGNNETKNLGEVAPRVGMSYGDLMSMGPRVASHTGTTLGTSRRIIYLLACSGQASETSLERQANQAGTLAIQRRLSNREAVIEVLTQGGAGAVNLKDC